MATCGPACNSFRIWHYGISRPCAPVLGVVADQVGDVRERRPQPPQEDWRYVPEVGYSARKDAGVGTEARQVPR